MRLPRDMDAASLVTALKRFGYVPVRQTGSHIRLTTTVPHQHHITVPNHSPIKVGTLGSIVTEIAIVHRLTREAVIHALLE